MQLLNAVGSATELYHLRKSIRDIIPEASQRVADIFLDFDKMLDMARKEYELDCLHNIRPITCRDNAYPQRLLNTPDAPTVLYMTGNADLNQAHTLAIVGTRHCTSYGMDVCNQFIEELHDLVPDIMVFSGLAYGIDITAHRQCINLNIPNAAVLANGLDTVYPSTHRREANMICCNGALISEYPINTAITKQGFIARNRIIAGCCDATVVIESKEKGGSLHTANMAFDYQRDVYTFPGRITDKQSHGCIDLVYRNVASLIRNAEQFANRQGWIDKNGAPSVVQTELFVDIDDEETEIVRVLSESSDAVHIDNIAQKTRIGMGELRMKLLDMEMRDIIEACPGFRYRVTNRYRM